MKAIQKLGIVGFLVLCSVFSIAALDLTALHEQPVYEQPDDGSTDVAIHYHSNVAIYKTVATTGIKTLVYEDHNLLVDNGLEYIKQQIGSDASIASNSTKYISLSNDTTAPAASDTIILAEITANGFERALATYASNGTGAWNYTKVFTATNSQAMQLTGLNYHSVSNSDGNLFASLAFTPQSLLVNDQLTVIWSISVS